MRAAEVAEVRFPNSSILMLSTIGIITITIIIVIIIIIIITTLSQSLNLQGLRLQNCDSR